MRKVTTMTFIKNSFQIKRKSIQILRIFHRRLQWKKKNNNHGDILHPFSPMSSTKSIPRRFLKILLRNRSKPPQKTNSRKTKERNHDGNSHPFSTRSNKKIFRRKVKNRSKPPQKTIEQRRTQAQWKFGIQRKSVPMLKRIPPWNRSKIFNYFSPFL